MNGKSAIFAPQILINHESLNNFASLTEYGGINAFRKWSNNPNANKENKTIFWVFGDVFLNIKYSATVIPAQSRIQKK